MSNKSNHAFVVEIIKNADEKITKSLKNQFLTNLTKLSSGHSYK